jgi:hypothetical protein
METVSMAEGIFETAVVAKDDALAFRGVGRIFDEFGSGEFAGLQRAKGIAHGGNHADPVVFGDGSFEAGGSRVPGFGVFAGIGDGEPGFSGFLGEVFWFLLRVNQGGSRQEHQHQKRE